MERAIWAMVQLLKIIENQYVGLVAGKQGNEPAKLAARLLLVAEGVGTLFGVVGHALLHGKPLAVVLGFELHLLAVLHGLGEFVKRVQIHAHGIGYFVAFRLAPQLGFEGAGCVVELLLTGAEVSRSPIEFPETVEDGSADADARVLAEGKVVAGAESAGLRR